MKFYLFFLLILATGFGFEAPSLDSLFENLEKVKWIDQELNAKLPVLINAQLQGGYFSMPSARTYDAGTLNFGFSYVPPYRIWNLAFQFFDHIETTGNYWVFDGMEIFNGMGFGDDAERAANIKLILLNKKDGIPLIPSFAIGWNDFFGSCRFPSFYTVATQEFLSSGLEATLGWGNGRIKGFFGALAWSPFAFSASFFKSLSLIAEYDANDYLNHPSEHPKGRDIKHRINLGAQLDLWDLLHLSFNTLRGNDFAGSASLRYNLGSSSGFFPKIFDSKKYTAPINTEPLGLLRSRKELAQDYSFAFKAQGFDLSSLYFIPGNRDRLWMKVINVRYREENEIRYRLQSILSSLTPSNIHDVVVVMEADGVSEYEYRFRTEDLQKYSVEKLGDKEFSVIAPMREASPTPSQYEAALLYQRRKTVWILTFRPWMRTFFGSAKGKFKYELGLSLGSEGYLLDQIYYSLYGSYTGFSSMQDLSDRDTLNPSRIINVRTDTLRYNQGNTFQLTEAFLQKSFNWGSGWFSRIALGYFEPAYTGLAVEALYYPVAFNWAVGFEAATLLKRSYSGIGIHKKIRQLTDTGYEWFPYVGLQYFLDFYYQYTPFNVDVKIRAGQFLARDKGIRLEGGRTFTSGVRVGLWYTFTNANDVVNNKRYYDKGFSITLPLDLFMNQSSRTRIGYSMAAWLRDCGAQAATGKPLYPTLFWGKYNYEHGSCF